MKASKAAQNCSRIASRSIRISCRAPGITIACPALSRAAKRSVAGVAQTGSAPAATIRVGRRILRREARIERTAHEAERGVEPGDGRARRWRRRRAPVAACGVAGIAHRIARQPVAREGLRGDRGLAAAGHEGCGRSRAGSGRGRAAAASLSRLDDAERDHRRRGDEPPERQPALVGGARARSRRPSNARGRNAARGMCGIRTWSRTASRSRR